MANGFLSFSQEKTFTGPVVKNGRFYFYNPSFRRDTVQAFTKSTQKREPCYCGIKKPESRMSFVSSGQLILYIISTDATCGYGSGSIIVQVTNGTAPYIYTDTYYGFTGPPQNTGNFPSEGAGSHTITVMDANGTTTSAVVIINNILPGPVVVPAFVTKSPSDCFKADGEVTLQPNGGTAPYTYSLDLVNFQTSSIFSGLHAGDYQFYVKDAAGCIGTATVFVVSGLCDPLSIYGGGYTCANSGQLSAADLGQQGPYQYSLDGINYQPAGDFTGIGPGVITLYIKNSLGNIKIFSVNEAENCSLNLQYIAVDAACKQDNGIMTITGANGTPPYSYTIDGINYQNSNVFTNLAPGNYSVTVQDAAGEKSSLAATVYDKCPVVKATSTGETCTRNDGTITAGGFKGTQPYLFSLDGTNFQSNNVFAGLKAGPYVLTLKDAMGFLDTTHILLPDACMSINTITTNSLCNGKNGSITVNVTGGASPYLYSIDGINFQSSNVINNLQAGNYVVTVKDAGGVTATATATISNTPGATISATVTAASCKNTDGIINASNIGGSAPFEFSLDSIQYQTSGTFNNLDTGVKRVYIKDGNGCVSAKTIIVSLADNLTVDAGVNLAVCEGAEAQLGATSNGTSFLWSPSTGLSNTSILAPQVSTTATTLYFITAIDGICTHQDSVLVTVNPAPIPNAGSNVSICFGKTIQLTGRGGVQFSWSPSTYLNDSHVQDPIVTRPLSTVTYSLSVTDTKGCTSLQPAQVTVFVTPPAKVFAGNDTAILVNQSFRLNATDINNSGFTTYIWTPGTGLNNAFEQSPVATITHDIYYAVTASTPDGCEGRDTITIKIYNKADIYVPNAFTPNNDRLNDVLRANPFGIKEFKYFAVYNRFGQRVFYTNDASQGWDGTFHSVPQNSGVYVWMCAGVDFTGKVIHHEGSVILIR